MTQIGYAILDRDGYLLFFDTAKETSACIFNTREEAEKEATPSAGERVVDVRIDWELDSDSTRTAKAIVDKAVTK